MKALQGEICPATAILWSAVSPIKNPFIMTSLVVQWLRLCAPNAGDAGSIPGQGTRSHKPQLRASQAQPNKIFKEKKQNLIHSTAGEGQKGNWVLAVVSVHSAGAC